MSKVKSKPSTRDKKSSSSGPFEAYVREKYIVSRSLAETTEQQYVIAAANMDGYLRALKGFDGYDTFDIEDTTPELLSGFVKWYESRVQSRNTVRSKRTVLIAIVNHALERKQRVINSKFVRLPKPQRTLKDTWTAEEIAFLTQAAGAVPGLLPMGTSRGDYCACLISVAYETAARRGDLTRITVADATSGKPFKFLQRKTQNYATYTLTEETTARIRSMQHVLDGGEFVFQSWGKHHLEALTALAGTAMRRAGMSASDGCLKKLRRSSITEAERLAPGTGYVQAGHTTPQVTVSNYIDADTAYSDRGRPTVGKIKKSEAWGANADLDELKIEDAHVIAARATVEVCDNESVDLETMAIALFVREPSQSKKALAGRLDVNVRSLADGRMPRFARVYSEAKRGGK